MISWRGDEKGLQLVADPMTRRSLTRRLTSRPPAGHHSPEPGAPGFLARVAACLLIAFAVMPSLSAAETPSKYLLDAGDRLRISVFGRPELSGEYEVGASGEISFPLVGRVAVRGRSLEDVETAIESTFAAQVPTAPFVTAEITEYRPFYIDGDVTSPGAYPYRPGLNLMRAVALAGGKYSDRAGGAAGVIEKRRERETYDLLMQTFLSDTAREARLYAEKMGLDEVRFPENMRATNADPRVKEIIDNEAYLFETRKKLVNGQDVLLKKQMVAYDKAVEALATQKEVIRKKQRVVAEQLKRYQALVNKGVAPESQTWFTEVNAIDVETELRELELATLDAQQRRIQVEQSLVNLHDQRAREIADEYLQVQERLVEAGIRIRASAERLGWMSSSSLELDTSAAVTIRRKTSTGYETFTAVADTPILPGDQIAVPFPKVEDTLPVGAHIPSRIKQK